MIRRVKHRQSETARAEEEATEDEDEEAAEWVIEQATVCARA
jgi:hypothetical protein